MSDAPPSPPITLKIKPGIWRDMFDAIEDPIFLHDSEFHILFGNTAYYRAAGISAEEAAGLPYWQIFPRGNGPTSGCTNEQKCVDESFATDNVAVGEKLFLSRHYQACDNENVLCYGLHMLSDITRQVATEQALSASEERLHVTVESARDAIITLDGPSGLISAWNPASEGIFGYSKQEAIGHNLHELLVPQRFHEEATAAMTHFATSGQGRLIGKTIELIALHKDGTEFPIELSLSATRFNGAWQATGIARDITERKRAHASEERYRRLFESAKDGILILDADTGMVVDANPFITELLGYSHEDVLEKYIWDLGFMRNVTANKEKFLELQQQEYVRYEDLPLETAQGEKVHVEFVSNVYLVGSKKVIQCNIRDITRRWKAEENNRRLSHMYRTISRCNETLVRAADEQQLTQEMCRILTEQGNFLMAWVGYTTTVDHNNIRIIASSGIETSQMESFNPVCGDTEQGGVCAALRTGEAAVCLDVRNDPHFAGELQQALRQGYLSVAAIPFKLDPHGLGILTVYGAQAHVFSADMVGLLTELAGDLAFGINNLRSRADRLSILEKLEHSLDHAVAAIATTVEMRDPYTAGHQRRVAKLASAIAGEMGLSDELIHGLHMACMVHDIGKIHVPAEILSSPSKLSDAEFAMLQTHPLAGRDILKEIEFPWPVAEIVYQHHEKLDGSGYPRGLKGDEILLEARILSVADVVEAMSSHRPYRPGFGIFPALQEISRQKGTLYDTAAVDACLRLFMEKNYEF